MRYVQIYSRGYPRSRGRVYEHRLVYENYHKCCLLKWADIHHINGMKTDNRIENLIAIIHGRHTALSIHNRVDHSNTRCLACGSDKTYMQKRKYCLAPQWFKHNDGYLCLKCHHKEEYKLKKEI